MTPSNPASDRNEPATVRVAAQAVADYSWGLHLAGTVNEQEAIGLIERLRAALATERAIGGPTLGEATAFYEGQMAEWEKVARAVLVEFPNATAGQLDRILARLTPQPGEMTDG